MHKYIKTKPRQNNVLMILHGNTRLILLCFRNRSKSKCWGDDETKNSFSLWNFFFRLILKFWRITGWKPLLSTIKPPPPPIANFYSHLQNTLRKKVSRRLTRLFCVAFLPSAFLNRTISILIIFVPQLCVLYYYIYTGWSTPFHSSPLSRGLRSRRYTGGCKMPIQPVNGIQKPVSNPSRIFPHSRLGPRSPETSLSRKLVVGIRIVLLLLLLLILILYK